MTRIEVLINLIPSTLILALGGVIWKFFNAQVAAAKAQIAVTEAREKTWADTVSLLKESHAGQISTLQYEINLLKEQRDFGSVEARKIREQDVQILEEAVNKLKQESGELKAKLDEAMRKNQLQLDVNAKLISKLESMKLSKTETQLFSVDAMLEGLKSNNQLLVDNSGLLEGLHPQFILPSSLQRGTKGVVTITDPSVLSYEDYLAKDEQPIIISMSSPLKQFKHDKILKD